MIHSISNSFIKVEINSCGAELMSIKSLKDNLEYLWQGDEKFWKRRSPILFPIVGRFNDDRYVYKGKEYSLELHGFTKECEFKLVENTGQKIVFLLKQNQATLEKYPFAFKLITTYSVEDNALTVEHIVINKNRFKMWFSIGEHPGFNCPLFEGEKMEDYRLVFDKNENIEREFIENALMTGKSKKFLENQKIVQLSEDLFNKSAVVLKGIQSNSLTIESNKHNKKIRINFNGYPNVAIWSKETGAPFVCIEPWNGIPSTKGKAEDIDEKEGLIHLDAGSDFACRYEIIIN
ncbi:MAG: hypothetical protein A2Y21_02790 [Clostridiales bacterium GWC2_40_7]|nr:MAG: hypothetical protein A2Y21_02790 [Clostridiales bacterium GWC2_40_7]